MYMFSLNIFKYSHCFISIKIKICTDYYCFIFLNLRHNYLRFKIIKGKKRIFNQNLLQIIYFFKKREIIDVYLNTSSSTHIIY